MSFRAGRLASHSIRDGEHLRVDVVHGHHHRDWHREAEGAQVLKEFVYWSLPGIFGFSIGLTKDLLLLSHRAILASHSSYLRQLMWANVQDAGVEEDPTIVVRDVSSAHLRLMMQVLDVLRIIIKLMSLGPSSHSLF